MRQSWGTMTSVSAGHIIPTPTQPVGSGRPQRESNPGPPHQESRTLPTELSRPPLVQYLLNFISLIEYSVSTIGSQDSDKGKETDHLDMPCYGYPARYHIRSQNRPPHSRSGYCLDCRLSDIARTTYTPPGSEWHWFQSCWREKWQPPPPPPCLYFFREGEPIGCLFQSLFISVWATVLNSVLIPHRFHKKD